MDERLADAVVPAKARPVVCSQAERDLLACVDVDPQHANRGDANFPNRSHLAEDAHGPAAGSHYAGDARVRRQAVKERKRGVGGRAQRHSAAVERAEAEEGVRARRERPRHPLLLPHAAREPRVRGVDGCEERVVGSGGGADKRLGSGAGHQK